MRFDLITIFPRMVRPFFEDGVIARAIERGAVAVAVHDLRDHTTDRHRVVDDTPFGGGPGMVLKVEPLVRAVEALGAAAPDARTAIVMPSPQGRPFTHAEAARLAALDRVVLLCGRYEGIDERVREIVGAEELSVGDFVLSGGELAALAIVDAVARLVPGTVGDERSVVEDSFVRGVLDHPHYTRPAEFRGYAVPPVLLSGHHADIRRWRRREALRRTLERRPDLLESAALDDEQREILRDLRREREKEHVNERD